MDTSSWHQIREQRLQLLAAQKGYSKMVEACHERAV
jgi:hypothetical protein